MRKYSIHVKTENNICKSSLFTNVIYILNHGDNIIIQKSWIIGSFGNFCKMFRNV